VDLLQELYQTDHIAQRIWTKSGVVIERYYCELQPNRQLQYIEDREGDYKQYWDLWVLR